MPDVGWVKKTEAESARQKAKTDTIDLIRLGDLLRARRAARLFLRPHRQFHQWRAWGRVTDSPIGVVFCNETIMRPN